MKISRITFLANANPKKTQPKKETNSNKKENQSVNKKVINKDELLKRPQKYTVTTEKKAK